MCEAPILIDCVGWQNHNVLSMSKYVLSYLYVCEVHLKMSFWRHIRHSMPMN